MFYFKGIASNTKGIIVSKTPNIPKGSRRVDKISIPGRNGFLTIDEGTYDSFIVSVECHFDKDVANQEQVFAWLDGSGKFSLNNEREFDAIIINSIKPEKVTNFFKEFIVQFECQPISKDKTVVTFITESNPDTLTIANATADMYPIIEITGTGDVTVTINNKTFNLYDMDGKYILDCDLKVITNNSGSNISDKMLYNFPKLVPGDNVISTTGTITEFKIKYQKAYL